jgi:sugar/nucleoside kinase (ribokinase family)
VGVLVVGGIFREIRDADSRPRPAMGGSGLTAAIVAARLGAKTKLASYVGAEDAQAVFANLETVKVDYSSVLVLPGASGTFLFPSNETAELPWPMYRPAEAVPLGPISLPDSEIVLAFGIPEFDPFQVWLSKLSADTLVWDRQGFISRSRDPRAAAALDAGYKIYLANMAEARDEFPADSVAETFAQLPPKGFQAAVIKRGVAGSIVIDAAPVEVAAFPVTTGSTIGSGDAFAGGLVAGLDRNLDLVEAVRFGNAAAATFLRLGGPLEDGFAEGVAALLARTSSA